MSRTDFDPHNVTGKFVLDADGEPVEERDLFKWAEWFETADRRVLYTQVGHAVVSTIFLALDHSFDRVLDPSAPPVLWETMVFGEGSAFHHWGRRYWSKLDALAGHVRMCEQIEHLDAPMMPRRLKKALRKRAADRPLGPRERQRVRRWHTHVSAYAVAQHA